MNNNNILKFLIDYEGVSFTLCTAKSLPPYAEYKHIYIDAKEAKKYNIEQIKDKIIYYVVRRKGIISRGYFVGGEDGII